MQRPGVDVSDRSAALIQGVVSVTGEQVVGRLGLEPVQFSTRITVGHGDAAAAQLDQAATLEARPADRRDGKPQPIELLVAIAEDEVTWEGRQLMDDLGNRDVPAVDQRLRTAIDEQPDRGPGPHDLIVGIGENSNDHRGVSIIAEAFMWVGNHDEAKCTL